MLLNLSATSSWCGGSPTTSVRSSMVPIGMTIKPDPRITVGISGVPPKTSSAAVRGGVVPGSCACATPPTPSAATASTARSQRRRPAGCVVARIEWVVPAEWPDCALVRETDWDAARGRGVWETATNRTASGSGVLQGIWCIVMSDRARSSTTRRSPVPDHGTGCGPFRQHVFRCFRMDQREEQTRREHDGRHHITDFPISAWFRTARRCRRRSPDQTPSILRVRAGVRPSILA